MNKKIGESIQIRKYNIQLDWDFRDRVRKELLLRKCSWINRLSIFLHVNLFHLFIGFYITSFLLSNKILFSIACEEVEKEKPIFS